MDEEKRVAAKAFAVYHRCWHLFCQSPPNATGLDLPHHSPLAAILFFLSHSFFFTSFSFFLLSNHSTHVASQILTSLLTLSPLRPY